MEWKTYDDLRSSLSVMQFIVESNNRLYFPLSQCILLFLAEKQGLGHQLPSKALSAAVCVSEFWSLITSILSLHCPRL